MVAAPNVFVIRIWLERMGGGSMRRGYVEHIASGRRRYFSDLTDALDFVAALDALPGTARALTAAADAWGSSKACAPHADGEVVAGE